MRYYWARFQIWLEETHSTSFELRRHFLLRFFDSELISSPAQWKVVAGGMFGLLLSVSLIYTQAYYHKYRMLDELPDPQAFQFAATADFLFLITLSMLVTALFTTLEWPSLFPGLRDYLALAGLPIRMRELFTARFSALTMLAAAVIFATNVLPSIILPVVMSGGYGNETRWQVPGLFISGTLAGTFVFFTLVAVQGVLLNILPVRQFTRVSLAVQGLLLAALLCALPLVFSIPNLHGWMGLRPSWGIWVPPLWFLGVDQVVAGNWEPYALRLSIVAMAMVASSAVAAVGTYIWSYRRHRVRVLEATAQDSGPRQGLASALAARWIPEPRQHAVFSFIGKTLARSRQHRLILTAYAALAIALIFESFVSVLASRGFHGLPLNSIALRQAVVSAPLAASLFLLAGFRYLFRLPVELRANWLFRMSEPGNRLALLAGVERFLLCWGIVPVAVLSLPFEIALLGVSDGASASLLSLLCSIVLLELLLVQSEKIPFTSSYLPGRRPVVLTVVLYAGGIIIYVSFLGTLITAALRIPGTVPVLAGICLFAWWRARRARMQLQAFGQIEFEELPEITVQTLSIERD